jgi:hypothetical protein
MATKYDSGNRLYPLRLADVSTVAIGMTSARSSLTNDSGVLLSDTALTFFGKLVFQFSLVLRCILPSHST